MNVLVIPTWYPNPQGEDKLMGIYHKEFCEALAQEKNVKVNMLFIDRQRLKSPLKYLLMPKKEIVQEKNYQVYIQRMLNINKISPKLQLKKYVKVLDKAFKKYLETNPKPDILHAQVTIPAGYAACKLGEKYHIPVVVTEHATYYKRFFSPENKEYSDYVIKNAYFTTVSKYMLNDIPNYAFKKDCLPNLVDTSIFKSKKRTKIKGMRIAKVSALRQGKQIDELISAIKIIVEEKNFQDVKLTIVGDGYLEDYYKNKCHEMQMDDYVDFVGRKTKEEIADILAQNNIFAISSDNETFCIPGIEALASGMPIVSTKCFGPEEYIDDKCGILVDVGNPKQMADALYEVYNNLDKYDVSYLRKVADQYSSKAIIAKALNIYSSLINNQKGEIKK